ALSQVQLRGTLKNATLDIEKAIIGKPGDTIHGKIKGQMGLRFNRVGNGVQPEFVNYDFKLDLSLDRAAEKNFGVFLSFYDKYKSVTGTGSRYVFRIFA